MELSGPAGLRLPDDVARSLVAATREALRNVVQHAGTSRAVVSVALSNVAVTITVSDAGVGFAPDAADGRRGVRGSIAARLDDIGGSASIASIPGRGTLVELRWTPVQRTAFAPRVIGGGAISRIFPFVLLTDPDLAAHLAPRELEVLRLLGEGAPRKSIGRRLDPPVSLTTVITYLDRVRDRYRALGRTVDTPADAVRAATADG